MHDAIAMRNSWVVFNPDLIKNARRKSCDAYERGILRVFREIQWMLRQVKNRKYLPKWDVFPQRKWEDPHNLFRLKNSEACCTQEPH